MKKLRIPSSLLLSVFLIIVTILLNHLDLVFRKSEQFNFLGMPYEIQDGYLTGDLVWTVIQKFNMILYTFAVLLILPIVLNHFKMNSTSRFFIKLVLYIVIIANVFMMIDVLHSYLKDFDRNMLWTTFLTLVFTGGVAIYLLGKISKKIIQADATLVSLKKYVNDRIEGLQVDHLQITEDINLLENIPEFITNERPDLNTWSEIAKEKAAVVYQKIDEYKKELEKMKFRDEA